MNKLILGDNLEILRQMEAETVDLIYLDPPFFSNRNYEVIWGDKGEIRSFEDRWSGGIDHYIAWLKERVIEMHRLLKPTGSIFLHCDWHANAYIRVFVLDKAFKEENFRGEIIWQRHNAHNDAKKKVAVLTDTVWYYSKSKKCTYNAIYAPFDEENNHYKFKDERGRYFLGDLTAPNIRHGESGKPWRGINPTSKGRSWAVPNIIVESIVGKDQCSNMNVLEKLDLLFDNGFIVFSRNGIPSVKRYIQFSKGKLIGNIWNDIGNISSSKERIGYPTQKPEALLERIIQMASNENDVILDPFVGGGTTVAVADKLNRNWIGIDQSVQAIKVSEMRLQKQQDLFSKPFVVQLHKYDYDTLRSADAFEFESWIIQQFGGVSNTKQRNDFGLDGYYSPPDSGGAGSGRIPIQVKRSDNVGRNVIDNFQSACKRYDNNLFEQRITKNLPVGILMAFSFSKGAIQEVARLKNQENINIQLVTVEEIVPLAKKPRLTFTFSDLGLNNKKLREIEFVASGESEAGIEFYAWDFNFNAQEGFKAQVMIDRIGKQIQSFKTGHYQIAVKAVDNEGLETMETIELDVS